MTKRIIFLLVTSGAFYCFAYYYSLTSGRPLWSAHTPWAYAARHFYDHYARNVWQGQRECVDFDERLLYKPKDGTCYFKNVEFATELSFKDGLRISSNQKALDDSPTIAIIGDSFSMGWGVNDGETFAARLANELDVGVLNFSVSSYGTYRELTSLIRSDKFRRVETIIIQYCDNDYDENMAFVSNTYPKPTIEKFNSLFVNDLRQRWQTDDVFNAALTTYKKAHVYSLLYGAMNYFRFGAEFGRANRQQASDLKAATLFLQTINKFPELMGKRIIVFDMTGWNTTTNFVDHLRNLDKDNRLETFKPDLDESDYYFLDGHLNARGHSKVALQIASVLRN